MDGGRQTIGSARLGSFERWFATMGGILGVAGISGLLANLDQLYEAADQEGQAWQEFTAAWWDAFRDQPKKVSELNEFCEQRELMLKLRGDGSLRSQQTRLGTALGSCRDRSFDRLRICRIGSGTKHKGVTMYALAQVAESDHGGRWEPDGDLADKGPHDANANNREDYELFGDLGELEGVSSRVESDFCTSPEGDGENLHTRACNVVADRVPKVPTVPNRSTSHYKEDKSPVETSGGEVPTSSPRPAAVPKTADRPRVDLADFDESRLPPDGKRS